MDVCAKCGKDGLVEAKLMSTMASLFMRPKEMKHLTLYMGSPFVGKVCEECGYIEFFVDVEVFNALRKDRKSKEEQEM